jgi:hypothetical protein
LRQSQSLASTGVVVSIFGWVQGHFLGELAAALHSHDDLAHVGRIICRAIVCQRELELLSVEPFAIDGRLT